LIEGYTLEQNYPNPFNTATIITFQLASSHDVSLKIFNLFGRKVRNLVNERRAAGKHQITWNGRDNLGIPVSSGEYFYKLETEKFVRTNKMLLLR
jgi:flagellar hook assembly protein FlgD